MNLLLQNEIDALCDEFESALAAGETLTTEDLLTRVDADCRSIVLTELLGLEADYRRRTDHELSYAEALRRFPQDRESVNAVFGVDEQSRDFKEQEFGEYRLLEEIARGGMGVVFKARNERLNRIVALKMILSANLASEEAIQRFEVEARAAAALDHPGIIPIHSVGEHDGQHYFTMPLVDGESLAERLHEGPLSAEEACSIVLNVAEAVHYAHEMGVVHRDLKPANILLDRQGRTRVADFGLAKQKEGNSNLTSTGQVIGTPNYMAPEQARGTAGAGEPAVDVHALGAIFYCLLTGRPPFQAATVAATLQLVTDADPVSPRQLDPSIHRDLETICLKCLAKEPEHRYATAAELVDELKCFRDGKPIKARPLSPVARGVRWTKRRPAIATLLGGLALAIVGGTGTSLWFAHLARQEAKGQLAAREKAEQNFLLALNAVNKYFTQVSEETLLNEPGLQRLRADLLGSAREFYDQFSAEHGENERLQKLRVDAMYNQGKIADAIESKTRALEILRRAYDAAKQLPDVTTAENLLRLARIEAALGNSLADTGKVEESRPMFESGLAHCREALRLEPDNRDIQFCHSDLSRKLSSYWVRKGEFQKALSLVSYGDEVLDSDVHATDPRFVIERAHAACAIGALEVRLGNFEKGIEENRRSIQLSELASKLKPTSAFYRWIVAQHYKNLSISLHRVGRNEESIEAAATAIGKMEELCNDFPLSSRYHRDLGQALQSAGTTLWGLGEFDRACGHYQRALQIYEDLVARHSDSVDYKIRRARALQNLAVTYEKLGDQARVEENYLAAVTAGEEICALQPDDARLLSDLSRYRSGLAGEYLEQGRNEDAESLLVRTLSQAQQQYRQKPHFQELAIAVLEATFPLGHHYRRHDQEELAIKIFDEGLEVAAAALDAAPGHESIRRGAYNCAIGRGKALFQMNQVSQADSAFQQAEEYAPSATNRQYATMMRYMLQAYRGAHREMAADVDQASAADADLDEALAMIMGACDIGAMSDELLESGERENLRRQYREKCLTLLRESKVRGDLVNKTSRRELQLSPALESVRALPEFQAIFQEE